MQWKTLSLGQFLTWTWCQPFWMSAFTKNHKNGCQDNWSKIATKCYSARTRILSFLSFYWDEFPLFGSTWPHVGSMQSNQLLKWNSLLLDLPLTLVNFTWNLCLPQFGNILPIKEVCLQMKNLCQINLLWILKWHFGIFCKSHFGIFSLLDILDIDLNQSDVKNYPWIQATYYIVNVTTED